MAHRTHTISVAARLWRRLRAEWTELARVQKSDRPWQLPAAAAIASGGPLLAAAWHGNLALGLAASLGGLVFLYLPRAAGARGLARVAGCAIGMVASHAIGTASQVSPAATVAATGLVAFAAALLCRWRGVGPPAALFFVMAVSIAAQTPVHPGRALLNTELLAAGCLLALAVAVVYRLLLPHDIAATPARPAPAGGAVILAESLVIGSFVALSLAVAQTAGLERPYWVPVSCMAVLQGASLRAAWTRQLQRIAGTGVGMLLFGALAAAPLTAWHVAAAVTGLTFVVETLVVRHYGAAVVFITPLAVLLAEAAQLPGQAAGHSVHDLMQARLLDTVIGCLFGLAGAAVLHMPALRSLVGRWVRRDAR
jgi:hypothetical protein